MAYDVQARVVEVLRVGAGCGSGYAVAADLVLTAAHVVGEDTEVAVIVGREELRGSVVWRRRELDAALVQVPSRRWDGVGTRWARVSGVRPVPCTAIGYPRVQRTGDGARVEEHIAGFIMPATGHRIGRYAINVISALPYERKRTDSPWAGMSGAAVLTGDGQYLLGILTDDPTDFEPSRLEAVPVAHLLNDPAFSELVSAGPTALVTLTDARPRSIHTEQWHADVSEAGSCASKPPTHSVAARLAIADAIPFVPRPELQERLEGLLQEGHRLISLEGDRGTGKSRLALELVRSHARTSIYLNAATKTSLYSDVAAALASRGIRTNPTGGEIEMAFSSYLSGDDAPPYVILDDAEGPDLIDGLLPSDHRTVVIVTSNRRIRRSGKATIIVGAMDQSESATLARNIVPTYLEREAVQLAYALLGRPIAIVQACKAMSHGLLDASRFIDLLQDAPLHALALGDEMGENSLTSIYQNIFDALVLADEGQAATAVLRRVAFLAHENIPLWLIRSSTLANIDITDVSFARAISLLTRIHLLELVDGTLSIHPLTQVLLADRFSKDATAVCLSLHDSLRSRIDAVNSHGYLATDELEWVPHLAKILTRLGEISSSTRRLRRVGHSLAVAINALRQLGDTRLNEFAWLYDFAYLGGLNPEPDLVEPLLEWIGHFLDVGGDPEDGVKAISLALTVRYGTSRFIPELDAHDMLHFLAALQANGETERVSNVLFGSWWKPTGISSEEEAEIGCLKGDVFHACGAWDMADEWYRTAQRILETLGSQSFRATRSLIDVLKRRTFNALLAGEPRMAWKLTMEAHRRLLENTTFYDVACLADLYHIDAVLHGQLVMWARLEGRPLSEAIENRIFERIDASLETAYTSYFLSGKRSRALDVEYDQFCVGALRDPEAAIAELDDKHVQGALFAKLYRNSATEDQQWASQFAPSFSELPRGLWTEGTSETLWYNRLLVAVARANLLTGHIRPDLVVRCREIAETLSQKLNSAYWASEAYSVATIAAHRVAPDADDNPALVEEARRRADRVGRSARLDRLLASQEGDRLFPSALFSY